jgi:hypothetical protein
MLKYTFSGGYAKIPKTFPIPEYIDNRWLSTGGTSDNACLSEMRIGAVLAGGKRGEFSCQHL